MALAYEVDSIEGLDDGVKSLYVESEGGKFRLDVSGIDDGAELKTALDHERVARKKATDDLRVEQAKSRKEAEAAAVANGNHKELYESATATLEAERAERAAEREGYANKERDSAAMKIATGLADGYNAEMLSGEIAKRLKHVDGIMKVLDVNGGVTINTFDDLATEFKGNERYSSLLRGNQSSGGGANGGGKGGGAANVITRGEFNTLNPIAAAKFMSEGGSVTD